MKRIFGPRFYDSVIDFQDETCRNVYTIDAKSKCSPQDAGTLLSNQGENSEMRQVKSQQCV